MMWRIKPFINGLNDKEKRTVLFAAKEMKRYLEQVFDEEMFISVSETMESSGIYLGVNLNDQLLSVENAYYDDAILIDIQNRSGIITGSNARSVLIGVYRYLKEIGFDFIRPGKNGEKIPQKVVSTDVHVNEKASVRYRTIAIEGSIYYDCIADLIDWLPKVGLNGYFNQCANPMRYYKWWCEHRLSTANQLTGDKNLYLESFEMTDDEVLGIQKMTDDEISKRSLIDIRGGHGIIPNTFQLPETWNKSDHLDISEETRECCAMVNGKRGLYDNRPLATQMCFGNPKVRDRITDYAVKFIGNLDADIVNFSFADGFGNYCECDLCRDKRPSEHMYVILNELDEKLTKNGINTRIFVSMYEDKAWPPRKEYKLNNPDRYILASPVIHRSYSEPLFLETDYQIPEYELNNKMLIPQRLHQYSAYINAWRGVFSGENILEEYYYMWDCYFDPGYMQIARLMYDDMRRYNELGFKGIIHYQSQRVFCPTSLGMNIKARTLWNAQCDFNAERDSIMSAEFGKDYKLVVEFLEKLSNDRLTDIFRFNVKKNAPGNTECFEQAIKTIDEFLPVIHGNIKTCDGVEKVSWEFLAFYSELISLVFQGARNVSMGIMDLKDWDKIRDFADRNEWKFRQYYDVYLFKFSMGRVFRCFFYNERATSLWSC